MESLLILILGSSFKQSDRLRGYTATCTSGLDETTGVAHTPDRSLHRSNSVVITSDSMPDIS